MKRRNFLRAALALPLVPLVGSEVFSVPVETEEARLIRLMKSAMSKGVLTGKIVDHDNLYFSTEALADINAWNVQSVDYETRQELMTEDVTLKRIYG